MRIVYFGGGNRFSSCVLGELLRLRLEVRAVMLSGYAPARGAPGLAVSGAGVPDVVNVARRHGVAVEFVPPRDGTRGLLGALRRYRPEFGLSVCFPRRIPAAVCATASTDFLNLHPSLLPAYRGPAPLFWQLRLGERRTGVSVHRLTEVLDAGPVVARRPVALVDGARVEELERTLAVHGAALFAASLDRSRDGELSAWPQDESRASYHPPPDASDWIVPVTWPARRAFNFLRGAPHGYPLIIDTGRTRVEVESVLAFRPHPSQDEPLRADGQGAWVRFDPGSVLVRCQPPLDIENELT